MTERELLAAERARVNALQIAPWERRDCDGCGGERWYALNEDEEWECLSCAISRVESMADAIRDVGGRALWEAQRLESGACSPQEPGRCP